MAVAVSPAPLLLRWRAKRRQWRWLWLWLWLWLGCRRARRDAHHTWPAATGRGGLLTWDGPVVATSTWGDLLRAAGDWRRHIAAPHGGDVFVYDPFGSEPGVTSLRWSPLAGCVDPSVAYRRASAMVAVVGRGITDGEHWRAGAATILRAVFHAAAVASDGRSMVDVRRWLASQDIREPARLRREARSPAASWADDLQAMNLLGERERGSS